MEERDFDAIVVGCGCAGAVAAYELAKNGKSVLVVERAESAGAKNMSGGRIYTHSLRKVFDDETLATAPFERRNVHERITMMASDAGFCIDFESGLMRTEAESYSVLRAQFDQWLADQAEEAGAEIIYGIPVEDVLVDEERSVYGVRAGEDELTAHVVILCDGVNSLLTSRAVGYQRPPASGIAVGIKQVIELPANVITDRSLALSDEEGLAMLMVGEATKGSFGGGFMYTNRDSISLGIVAGIDAVSRSEYPIYEMMEQMKQHPTIAAFIRDGKVVEHSGHMVPEGGLNIMPQLTGNGVLVAGEAAMMCVNYGYAVRGMDYAVASGQFAAQAAATAIDSGDVTQAGLHGYIDALEDSFVMKDLRNFKEEPAFLEHFDRMFNDYPAMVRDIMADMFIIDGSPTRHLKDMVMPAVKKVGIVNVAKDAMGAMRKL